MRLRDLGRLDGALLFFGGPYSNLPALRAVLAQGAAMRIAHHNSVCTGDIAAYGAEAAACIALVRDLALPCIVGNVEVQLGAGAQDCGCGFEEGSTCDLASGAWFAHASEQCDAALRGWMAEMPGILTLQHAGRRVAVLHGGVTDVARFLWPTSPEVDFREEIDALEALTGPVDLVVAGHSGLPFLREIGDVTWLNAGVIGMPPHDGRPQTAFATLDPDGSPTLHRLDYDHNAAAAAMKAGGLTQGYDEALISGWWPSEDILPPELRRVRPQSSSRARGW